MMNYDLALDALRAWAADEIRVRALVLTGSAAARRTDEYSDRDVQIFTTDVPALAQEETWWESLGELLAVEKLTDADGNPTRLLYYAGGKLDFTILPAPTLDGRRYAEPFEVLVDKDALGSTAALAAGNLAEADAQEFSRSVN